MHTYGPANPGVNNDGTQFFGALPGSPLDGREILGIVSLLALSSAAYLHAIEQLEPMYEGFIVVTAGTAFYTLVFGPLLEDEIS